MSINRTSQVPIRSPIRAYTNDTADMSDDDAIPGQDPKDTTELLAERLRAWKHAVGYIENYVSATEKVHKAHAKEYEKVLKTISDPLREGHHFAQELGGIADLMENMRTNTQQLSNSHLETEKNIKGSVLPILERLHKEIKNKSKELTSGAGKSAKEVDKARAVTQKHIELLGQETASFGSAGSRLTAQNDPYVIQRGVLHRLNKQIMEENNNRNDTIAIQNQFATFEAHIIEVIKSTMSSFNQFVGVQAANTQNMYANMLSNANQIPPNFEWDGFLRRNGNLLVDPNSEPRSLANVSFPNQDHRATVPIIEGTLERKSRSMLKSGYSAAYYVVTPAKYLHEFKDNDNFKKDPTPETSIYLPDATIGTPSGAKFNVKGKDVSKGLAAKLSGTSEMAFQAASPADALKWFEAISAAAGNTPVGYSSEPTSPTGPVEPNTMAPSAMAPAYSEKPVGPIGQGMAPINTQVPQATGPLSAATRERLEAESAISPVSAPAVQHTAPYPEDRKL